MWQLFRVCGGYYPYVAVNNSICRSYWYVAVNISMWRLYWYMTVNMGMKRLYQTESENPLHGRPLLGPAIISTKTYRKVIQQHIHMLKKHSHNIKVFNT